MISDYVGIKGTAFNVESVEEVHEAIDILHTQVMDNISDKSPILSILENTMCALEELMEVAP